MKAILAILSLLVVAALLANTATAAYPPQPPPTIVSPDVKVGDLIADGGPDGDHLDVGDVYFRTIYDPSGNHRHISFYISTDFSFSTFEGWVMTAVYVDVQTSPELFPQNGNGNPKAGQFLFNEVDTAAIGFGANSLAISVSNDASMNVYVAIHATVYHTETDRIEGAWAKGLEPYASNGEFTGPSWATYIVFESQQIYWWPSEY